MFYPVPKAQIRAVVSMIEEKATVMRGGGQKCLTFCLVRIAKAVWSLR